MLNQLAMSVLRTLMDGRLELCRVMLREAILAKVSEAPPNAGEAMRTAIHEYFAEKEREFVAEINKVLGDN